MIATKTIAPAPAPAPTLRPAPKMPPTLGANALGRGADYDRGHFFVRVSNTTTFEQVMTPAYWANHVAVLGKLPHALIEVVREDGSMDLDLRVMSVGPGMVKMLCLRKHLDDSNIEHPKPKRGDVGPTDDSMEMPEGYKYVHIPNGAERGHAVQLKSNGAWLKKGLSSKAEAVALAIAHKAEAETSLAT